MARPECFEFAMDYLGDPEARKVVEYITKLESALKLAVDEADMGGSRELPEWIEQLLNV